MLNPDISFNVFRPPLIGLKLGSDDLVETDHSNPQLRRDHDLFNSLPKLITRNCVESFSEVHKATEEINFTIVIFLHNDSKSDQMVNSSVMSPKTSLSFSSFSLDFKPEDRKSVV